MIQYTVSNCYVTVDFDNKNGLVKTELHQKMLLQLSVRELHIDMVKKDATGFSMVCYDKVHVRIIDSSLVLLLPSPLRNMI